MFDRMKKTPWAVLSSVLTTDIADNHRDEIAEDALSRTIREIQAFNQTREIEALREWAITGGRSFWGEESRSVVEPVRATAKEIHDAVYAEADAYETMVADTAQRTEAHLADKELGRGLLEMGFTAHPAAQEYRQFRSERDTAAEVRANLERLRLLFPQNRIISVSALNDVQKKFGLVRRGIAKFVGDVPATAMADMLRFETARKRLAEDGEDLLKSKAYEIAAPATMFAAEPQPRWNWLVDDPIVLYPIPGAYIIVTAWGDEASDPAVVSEARN